MANPNTMLLHGNLSLFSGQGAQIYSHKWRSLWGSSAWDSKKTRNQEGGSPEFEKSPNASSKVRLHCGEWSERLVSKTRQPAATEFALKCAACQ